LIDIVPLERSDVTIQHPFLRFSYFGGDTLVAAGERRAGSLQRAIDGGYGSVQRFGHFRGGPTQHLDQEQNRALLGRKMLESRHESEPDALAQDGSFGWIGVRWDSASIGNRLELMRAGALDQWVGGSAGGSLFHWTRSSVSMGKFIQADVSGDSIQPSPQCRASVEFIQTFPRADHRFLRGVVSVDGRAEHAVAVPG